jgi:hypothetical protein
MSTLIVAYRTDLLGGRLLNLMHGWRLARRLDAEFVYLWPYFTKWRAQSGYRDPVALLTQLFDLAEHALARPDLAFTSVDGLSVKAAVRRAEGLEVLAPIPDDPAAHAFAPAEDAIRTHWSRAAFTAATPLPLAGEEPATVRAEATALIRSLPLNGALSAALERVRQAADLDGAVTVNLRRGDIIDRVKASANGSDTEVRTAAEVFISRYAPEGAYATVLDEQPTRPTLVFSDSPAAAAAFAARRPDAIDGRALLEPIAAGLTPLQAHMLQLLVMSETQRILGSGSNFAIAAAYYGGRPYDDLRGRWTASAVAKALESEFPDASPPIIAALFDAFDQWFASQPDLADQRAELTALRTQRPKAG